MNTFQKTIGYTFANTLLIILMFGSVGLMAFTNFHSATFQIVQSLKFTKMKITSPAFLPNEKIPSQYTCEGKNINPPLEITEIPKNTKSLAIIMDDPDARASTWVHWVVWNIPVANEIAENTIPGVEGMNDFQKQHYGGPCPPSGTHRYFFKVYALDKTLSIPQSSDKLQLEKAMEGHVLGSGQLIGVYKKVH